MNREYEINVLSALDIYGEMTLDQIEFAIYNKAMRDHPTWNASDLYLRCSPSDARKAVQRLIKQRKIVEVNGVYSSALPTNC